MTEAKQKTQKELLHLAQVLERLNDAKAHFLTGHREILVALREILQLMADLSGQTAPGKLAAAPVYTFEAIAAIIDFFISQLPGPPSDEIEKARAQALRQLVELIDQEAERTGRFAAGERDLLKVEALMALKKYLLHELAHQGGAAKQRLTRVDIE